MISSDKNAFFKKLSHLDSSAGIKKFGLFLIEGIKEQQRFLDLGHYPSQVIVDDSYENYPEILALLQRVQNGHKNNSLAKKIVLSSSLLKKLLVRKTSLPCLFLCDRQFRSQADCSSSEYTAASGKNQARSLDLVLWEVEKPGNLGAIARSALASGVSKIVLGPKCCDPYHRHSIRNSLGHIFAFSITHLQDCSQLKEWAISHKKRIIGAALADRAKNLFAFQFPENAVLIMGSEAKGLDKEVLSVCDDIVQIPMSYGVDSLNVSAACSILCYEWKRQGS